jgi:hypothetical protein
MWEMSLLPTLHSLSSAQSNGNVNVALEDNLRQNHTHFIRLIKLGCRLKYFWLWLLAGALIGIAGLSTYAQSEDESNPTATPSISIVIVSEALLRGGPSIDYVTVGSLIEGTPLIPFNISEDGEWVLVLFRSGYGWIRRDLGFWVDDIDSLPILTLDSLTPTPPPTAEPAIIPFATETPVGNYVFTGFANVLVRTGPGADFPRLGRLLPGTTVEPFALDETGEWVLIRFFDLASTPVSPDMTAEPDFDGFGWVSRRLVFWLTDLTALPIMARDNLTPSPTPSQTLTPRPSSTSTSTPSPTVTLTPTSTATETAMPTNTESPTATDEPTETPTSTATETAIPTNTESPTATDEPTETPTATLTETAIPTQTESPTDEPTEEIAVIVNQPTETFTSVPTLTEEPSATVTETPIPTETQSPTQTVIPTEPPTETPTLESAIAIVSTDVPTPIPSATVTLSPAIAPELQEVVEVSPINSLPTELWIGAGILALLLIYILLYLRGQASVDRYASGFVLDVCPICEQGKLTVETRTERTLGIPSGRHTIRCNHCRSILRQKGNRQWIYAVDKLANEAMHKAYNGQTLSERELVNLQNIVPKPSAQREAVQPAFDDEPEN